MGEQTARSVAVDVGNGFADGTFIKDALLVKHAGQESGGAEKVHLSGDAFGVIEDAAESVVAEKLSPLKAGGQDMVLDVSDAVLQVEGVEMVANGQALVESLVAGQPEGCVSNQ